MGLCQEVRSTCAAIAQDARWVAIDAERVATFELGPSRPGVALDPQRHFLEGAREDVARYFLALDTINFGSGWFPTLRKRPGCSGYFTVAWALADRFRAHGPWSNRELREIEDAEIALALEQDATHELMGLYARALGQLGRFLGDRSALEVVADAGGSAERLAAQLADGMEFFADVGFYKRAQIAASDLAFAGVAEFSDLDRLTVFADNVVPHVLRVDGVLCYQPDLAARIDAGELLEPGECEREIRACAVHACELISANLAVAPRALDGRLWNRGRDPRYKAHPRHRTRTVFY